MQTRSQTRNIQQVEIQIQQIYTSKPIYEVNIDFDAASQAWQLNKKYIGNGHYVYICEHITQKGTICKKNVKQGLRFCCIHNK